MASQKVCDRCGKVIGRYMGYETKLFGDKYDLCGDCYYELRTKLKEWLKSEKPDDGQGGKPKKKRLFNMFGGM